MMSFNDKLIITNAVKLLITINRIQNKSFCLHMCVLCWYIYYVYKHTHTHNMFWKYLHVYIYIHIYIIYK